MCGRATDESTAHRAHSVTASICAAAALGHDRTGKILDAGVEVCPP
ncbi:hypothetical protein [Frankia sp. QA3]|nr:hypothetical protein [Frankia sp. QA3]